MSFRDRVRLIGLLCLIACAFAGAPTLAGTVSLAWDPVADSDLAGYRVEYGNATGSYNQFLDVGLSAQATLTGLTDCSSWFVAIKARDANDNFSTGFSNEISGWPRPTLAGVAPGAAEQSSQVDLVITGTNFRSGAAVNFTSTGITASVVNVISCTQLVATVQIDAAATLGSTTVEVVNPDQTFGSVAAAFQVQAAVPPTVTAANPVDGAVDVPVDTHPTLTFSEALVPASVTSAAVQLLDAAGTAVPQAAGSPLLSGNGLTVAIIPASPLVAGSVYRLQAIAGVAGVTDLSGHPLGSIFTQATGFQTVDTNGPAIASVSAGSLGATTAQISWSTDEAADSQVFFRRQGESVYQQTSISGSLVTTHSRLLQGLSPVTAYDYHVRSADAAGNGSVSSPDQTFTTVASSHHYLTFEAEAGNRTSPMQSASGAGAFSQAWITTPTGSPVGSVASPTGTASFGVNLPAGGSWFLWVRIQGDTQASNSFFEQVDASSRAIISTNGTADWEWVEGRSNILAAGLHSIELGGREPAARADRVLLTTDPDFVPTVAPGGDSTPPSAPLGLTTVGGDLQVTVAWTAPTDADLARMVVRYRTDGTFPVSPVDGLAAVDQAAAPGAPGSFIHTGLVNGTVYAYSLFAVDGAGNVSAAATVQGAPFDDQPPSQVQNLRRTDAVGGQE